MEKETVSKQLLASSINNELKKEVIFPQDIRWQKTDDNGVNWYIQSKDDQLNQILDPVKTHIDNIKLKFNINDEMEV